MVLVKSGIRKHPTRAEKTFEMLTKIVNKGKLIEKEIKDTDQKIALFLRTYVKTPKKTRSWYNKQFLHFTRK